MTPKPNDTTGSRDGFRLSKQTAAIVYGWFRSTERRQHVVTAEDMVAAAAAPASPLHPLFEWDDEVAANEFRLEQARYYLRAVDVTLPDFGDAKVRAILTTDSGFVSTRYALTKRPDVIRAQLDRLHREAETIAREYSAWEAIITARPDPDAAAAASLIRAARSLAEHGAS